MNNRENLVPVPGSERRPLPGARPVGAADPNERIQVTVRVRPQTPLTGRVQELAAQPPRQRRYLSHEEFEQQHGARPEDLDRVQRFAEAHHLDVVESSRARHTVLLSGLVKDFSAAFGVDLQTYEHPGGRYRGRTGPVLVPSDLADVVTGVLGLDNRPQAEPHNRRLSPANAADGSFLPPEVARLYHFPPGVNGQSQTIGIIELGGGFRQNDLTTYFNGLGIPLPPVAAISVDGGQNQPTGDPNGDDGEVMLDIEVAGAVAPGARIAVYFAPNTDQGFLDAITTAIHDRTNNPSVISISWGSAEAKWTPQAMQNMDRAFQAAAALGVTICCASGDNGSADGAPGDNVDFPASSPHALGCGGTQLIGSGSTITTETVWDDLPNGGGATGGGVSTVFPLPAWQNGAGVPTPGGRSGRGVPDVSGDAAPGTGYKVRVDGTGAVIGGTSAVAPLWAGLVACMNQGLSNRVGFLNPSLYALPPNAGAFHDILNGSNGSFAAGPAWDACTGLGSPDGAQLMQRL